jgi:Integrase core domain
MIVLPCVMLNLVDGMDVLIAACIAPALQKDWNASPAELSNLTRFTSLAHAREKIAIWAEDYNTGRPHAPLGYPTPAAFAADLKKQGAASLRIAGRYRSMKSGRSLTRSKRTSRRPGPHPNRGGK